MYSPSAELNAYILDYKARKSLENSPYSTPTNTDRCYSRASSKTWLQDVLKMPSDFRATSNAASPVSLSRTLRTPDIDDWLDEIDKKIEKKFPKSMEKLEESCRSKTPNMEVGSSPDSDKTIELLAADPETGLSCHCPSYDSHPNMTEAITHNSTEIYCKCNKVRAPAWVDEVINDDFICQSCIFADQDTLDNTDKNQNDKSVTLPKGYKLFSKEGNSKASASKSKKSKRQSKKRDISMEAPSIPATPIKNENIMQLLELAICQLNEVKVAVEDNTVSACTADLSAGSQVLSDILSDSDFNTLCVD